MKDLAEFIRELGLRSKDEFLVFLGVAALMREGDTEEEFEEYVVEALDKYRSLPDRE